MNPADLLLTGAIALGVALPVTAVVESQRPTVDMGRYVMSEDCPGVERCIVDTVTQRHMGLVPLHFTLED